MYKIATCNLPKLCYNNNEFNALKYTRRIISYSLDEVMKVDAEVAQAIEYEQNKQNSHIDLIASDDWVRKVIKVAR